MNIPYEDLSKCSRCGLRKKVMYHPEFVYQSDNDNRVLYKPEKLQTVILCANCTTSIVDRLFIDDVLDKVIMYRESNGWSIDRIGEVLKMDRDTLCKKYTSYLKKIVENQPTEDINKIGALHKAGWKTREIYYEFNQKIPLDVVSMITVGKMWKNKSDYKKERQE